MDASDLGELVSRNDSVDLIRLKSTDKAQDIKDFLNYQTSLAESDVCYSLKTRDSESGMIIEMWNVNGTDVRLNYGTLPQIELSLKKNRVIDNPQSDVGKIVSPVYLSIHNKKVDKRDQIIAYLTEFIGPTKRVAG